MTTLVTTGATRASRKRSLAIGALALPILLLPTGIMAQSEPMDPEMEEIGKNGENEDNASLVQRVQSSDTELSDATSSRLEELRSRPTSEAVEVVELNLDALTETRVAVRSAETGLTIQKTSEEPATGGGSIWYGTIGIDGQAVLIVKDGTVTGNLRTDEGLFELRPVGDGLHAIIKVNAAEFPDEHPPEWEDIEDHYPDQGDSSDGASPSSDHESNDSADVQMRELDILVACTSGALSKVTDMDALIALAIAENNLADRNSNVAIRVRLVDSFSVNYTESGNFFTDVARFRTNGDNYMDEVHTRRDQHGADMAVLIMMDNGQYCGLASAIRATDQTAFAGVHYTCATGNFTFAHELGHLRGARHNTQADPSTTPFDYGHGYYRLAQRDRTVMSYNCSGGCTRKAYWSNPDVSVLDAPMGTADENDNARVLNLTAAEVTNFRSVTGTGATGFAWANQPSSNNYTPSVSYSHNSAKAPIRISRANTGVYSVRFAQMGGKGSYGGNVQVTPWGSSSDQCKVSSWSSGGIDFVATVRCFSAAGAPKDSYFSVFVRWP